jgi:hypothetical protein
MGLCLAERAKNRWLMQSKGSYYGRYGNRGLVPNAVQLTVRGELVKPPATQPERFDKLRTNGFFLG